MEVIAGQAKLFTPLKLIQKAAIALLSLHHSNEHCSDMHNSHPNMGETLQQGSSKLIFPHNIREVCSF